MILEIQHETTLEYTGYVREWLTEIRMEPISGEEQRCHSFAISLSQPATIFRYVDGFGNRVHHFNLLTPNSQIRILAAAVVETDERRVLPTESSAVFPLSIDAAELGVLNFLNFGGPVRPSPRLDALLADLHPLPGSRAGSWVSRVGEFIRGRFEYQRYVTDASSPIDDLLQHGKGVCQDFAHLMLALCRSNGVPARYVSGYIHRPNKESQSHAWCETWLPDLGWVGFDPTNGCAVNGRFVKVAVGRDFTDVPPNKGVYRGAGQETISVRVATRELDRLPSISWQEQLPPLDVPCTAISRHRREEALEEQMQQQQQ